MREGDPRRALMSEQTLEAREVVISLTHRCPLSCSHCSVSSNMSRQGYLSLADVLRVIDQAAQVATVKRIDFVGGDPFLHPEILIPAFQAARERRLWSAVVTSAYWAKSYDRALQILQPMVEAGLDRITISYDDPHARFVRESNIVFAYQAARALGIHTLIAIAVEHGSKIDAAYMRQLLDGDPTDPYLDITEFAVVSTGRASENSSQDVLNARRVHPLAYKGPCKSIFQQISVHPNGVVTPCCGAVPILKNLVIGNIEESEISSLVDKAYLNPLFQWIAMEGPIKILAAVTEQNEKLGPGDFDGICTACEALYSDEKYLQRAAQMAPSRISELKAVSLVLQLADGVGTSSHGPMTDEAL